MPAADFEPADHGRAVRAGGHKPAIKLLRVDNGAIDGGHRASRQDRVHRVVGQSNGHRLPGVGNPLPVGQDVPLGLAPPADIALLDAKALRCGMSETATKSSSGSDGKFSGVTITTS